MLRRVKRDAGLASAFTRMCRPRRHLPSWCLRSLMTLPFLIISYKDCIHAQTKTYLWTTAVQFSTDSLFLSVCITGSQHLRRNAHLVSIWARHEIVTPVRSWQQIVWRFLRGKHVIVINGLFPCYLVPLLQNESPFKTLLVNLIFIWMIAPRLVLRQWQKTAREWPNETWLEIWLEIWKKYGRPNVAIFDSYILYSILYSMFNYLFNIQFLFSIQCFSSTQFVIQYSIIYLMFNFFSNIQLSIYPASRVSWSKETLLAGYYLFNVQLFSNIQLFIHCLTFSPTDSIIYSIFNFYSTRSFQLILYSTFLFSGQWLTLFPGCTLLSRNMPADDEDFVVEIDWKKMNIFVNETWKGELWSSISLLSIRRWVCFAHSETPDRSWTQLTKKF